MQTKFTPAQLSDPDIAEADKIFRACVHCGFCTATCPTYITLGDEADSPRGRIYQIKDMLEADAPKPATSVVTHIDRCLSCLSCMTTCPSGVHYMHLVDLARKRIEERHDRPSGDRFLRWLLALLLPRPGLFRLSLLVGRLARPFAPMFPGRLRTMIEMAPDKLPRRSKTDNPGVYPAEGEAKMRVALMTGCAQKVLSPAINQSTIRLLNRFGCDVVVVDGSGCCGSLVHHMGREQDAHQAAKQNIAAWQREIDAAGLDAIVINASGCGTTVKDYGFMLRHDLEWADKSATVSALAKDISEVLAKLEIPAAGENPDLPVVAYHAACSLQHGQSITDLPAQLLRQVGFPVRAIPEGHLCCGSAGTYNILQADLADQLLQRKLGNIAATDAAVIATGNIGCVVQLNKGPRPSCHTVELLDWATGGGKPANI